MTDLVFVRRRIAPGVVDFARDLFGRMPVVVSDERIVPESIWWGQYDDELQAADCHFFCEEAVRDIVRRCRFLREIPFTKSVELIAQAVGRWQRIIERHDVRRVLMLPVDSYVLDVLYRVAHSNSIKAYSFVGTPFSGRIRFTVYGEMNGQIGAVEPEVVASFVASCRHGEVKPDWLIGSGVSPERLAYGRLAVDSSKPPVFGLYRALAGDRDSFSFAQTRYLEKRMYATPARVREALSINSRASKEVPREFAFLPLQFYPESTSDYWVREESMHNHHAVVLAAARAIAPHLPVVVKEHPAAFGRRSAAFLRELSEIEGVRFVPYQMSVSKLLATAGVVVGQGSTTTLQALVAGTPVVFTGKPYFSADGSGLTILDSLENAVVRDKILEAAGSDGMHPSDSESIVHRFVGACAPGGVGGYKPYLERRSKQVATQAFVSDAAIELFQSIGTSDV